MRWFGAMWRGGLMGMADLVPGVSGGTMALLVGIYPRLIAALAALTSRITWRALADRRWRAAWAHVDGAFLTAVVAGIAVVVVLAAGGVEHLLETYRPWVYAAFLGLVAASAWVVWARVRRRGPVQVASFAATAAFAFALVGWAPVVTPDAPWFLALAGAIGICALVLPGVSGAFLLVLLGQYDRVLGAIAARDVLVLAPFAAGAAVGLLAFARVLSGWLRRAPDTTHAALAGFLVGSLRRVWPWQAAFDPAHGAAKLVLEAPPGAGAALAATALALAAFAAVLALEAGSRRLR